MAGGPGICSAPVVQVRGTFTPTLNQHSRTTGKTVFPEGQIGQDRTPLRGIETVIGLLGNGRRTWVWLNLPRNTLDGRTPLETLLTGDVERVAGAAIGELQGDFE